MSQIQKLRHKILGLGLLFASQSLTSPAEAAYSAPEPFLHGVVASDHPLASLAGMEVLRQGGNAFDAAVATSMVLSVVRPQSTGIGGGGFMLWRDARGKTSVLDYREIAPKAAHKNMFLDQKGNPIPNASTVGYRAIAVPGLLSGLDHINKKYGSKKLSELMQPAIKYAEEGFDVDEHLSHASDVIDERGARDELKDIFFEAGKARQIGAVQKNPELAASLNTIATEGVESFYTGSISKKIIAAMQKNNGLISPQDLAAYQPKYREPLKGTYRGYEIYTMPPPSSGGTALLTVLNLLEPYALGWNSSGFGSGTHVGLITEAMKHAFSDRANYLGDPDFIKIPLQKLISKEHARNLQPRMQQAALQTLNRDMYGLKGLSYATSLANPIMDHGTTHYAIMDSFGNVVSATETINTYFGSQVVIPGTGIVMNNEMDDFSKSPGVPNAFGLIGSEANAIVPGKKPLSSMTPSIVLKDGKPFMAVGASGGPRIITGTLQAIINVIDFGMNVNEAVSAPRFHHQWVPEVLYIEQEMPEEVRSIMRQKGHQLGMGPAENVVQAVMFKDGVFTGASDPRKGGKPAGY